MTISQSLVLVLLISIVAGITDTNLATNSNILIILLIALIALSVASYNFTGCNTTTLTTTNGSTFTVV